MKAALAALMVTGAATLPQAALAEEMPNVALLDEAKLGKSDILMESGRTTNGDTGLGNLVADAYRAALGTDFALVSADSVQGSINWGWISSAKVRETLPKNQKLYKYEIKGSDLRPILNAQLSTANGADYSISGFKYVWSREYASVFYALLPNDSFLFANATYTVAVSESIAASNPIATLGRKIGEGPTETQALTSHLTSFGGLIASEPASRIRQVLFSIPEKISIGEARLAPKGQLVTVEGVVTTRPGIWGGKKFYLEDGTGATFIANEQHNVRPGDRVRVTAKSDWNVGEHRLNAIVSLSVIGHGDAPAPTLASPAQVSDSTQSKLLMLQGVKIEGIYPPAEFGNFGFTVSKNGEEAFIRSDSRSGLLYEDFTAKFKVGDIVDCIGISNRWVDYLQLNVREPGDVRISQ